MIGTATFSKSDANSGIRQIPLAAESKLLTTFITPCEQFCFNKLPFGSAPEVFQHQISDILSNLPDALCHIDDILVCGSTQDDYLTHCSYSRYGAFDKPTVKPHYAQIKKGAHELWRNFLSMC